MNERPSGGEQVILVHINFPVGNFDEDLDEFKELASGAGAQISATITGSRRAPESKYFVGTGKAEEIRQAVLATHAQLVIFNHVLTPAQERNLERLMKCRVLDRTGLILDIFAQRARSFEGKLQVELALLRHLSTRLVRGWTHLERQQGGIGLRGPGETQLEVDRRLIRRRIKTISGRLAKISRQRAQGRAARRKAIIPTVSLVGYTNAGKSTIFNLLTHAKVFVANQLFATLDPTLRRINYPETGPVILADTVGFIKNLPHELIKAFHATLEEVSESNLLLHVVDANDPQKLEHIAEVDQVLESIQAQHVPRILVFNKIDLMPDLHQGSHEQHHTLREGTRRVFISALKNQGISELLIAIGEMLGNDMIEETIVLKPEQAKLRSKLYADDAVLSENIDDLGNYHLLVYLPRHLFEKLYKKI